MTLEEVPASEGQRSGLSLQDWGLTVVGGQAASDLVLGCSEELPEESIEMMESQEYLVVRGLFQTVTFLLGMLHEIQSNNGEISNQWLQYQSHDNSFPFRRRLKDPPPRQRAVDDFLWDIRGSGTLNGEQIAKMLGYTLEEYQARMLEWAWCYMVPDVMEGIFLVSRGGESPISMTLQSMIAEFGVQWEVRYAKRMGKFGNYDHYERQKKMGKLPTLLEKTLTGLLQGAIGERLQQGGDIAFFKRKDAIRELLKTLNPALEKALKGTGYRIVVDESQETAINPAALEVAQILQDELAMPSEVEKYRTTLGSEHGDQNTGLPVMSWTEWEQVNLEVGGVVQSHTLSKLEMLQAYLLKVVGQKDIQSVGRDGKDIRSIHSVAVSVMNDTVHQIWGTASSASVPALHIATMLGTALTTTDPREYLKLSLRQQVDQKAVQRFLGVEGGEMETAIAEYAESVVSRVEGIPGTVAHMQGQRRLAVVES